jgi:hypothetical protein
MIDQGHVAVVFAIADPDDLAITAGKNWPTDIRVEVEPLVKALIALAVPLRETGAGCGEDCDARILDAHDLAIAADNAICVSWRVRDAHARAKFDLRRQDLRGIGCLDRGRGDMCCGGPCGHGRWRWRDRSTGR